jgi:hypothetical protein
MATTKKQLAPAQKTPSPALRQACLFSDLGSRQVVADFTGGQLSTDGGALLLRQVDLGLGVTRELAACFEDARHPVYVEHRLPELLGQRLHTLALGYEDLNDHPHLRADPLLAACVGKEEPDARTALGTNRKGPALAAPSTLNRLELGNQKKDRYHKITFDPAQVEACVLKLGVRCLPKDAAWVILDLDAMGHLVHGLQEGRHFSAYYDGYCYLPLYIVAGPVVLCAQLRTADQDAASGVVEALAKVVPAVRQRLPGVKILVRGDSGFCRDDLLRWCEGQEEVYYCVGLAKNARLLQALEPALVAARMARCLTGATVRRFAEFTYQTRESWSRERRVVGKAEISAGGENPRFVVCHLPKEGMVREGERLTDPSQPDQVYEGLYCARGDMENVLKQQVLDLRADRLSTHYEGSNQLRLWLATLAYLLLERVRALLLAGTEYAQATVGTVRAKLLKVAALVTVSVRRVYVQLSSAYPWQDLFRLCQARAMQLRAGRT